MYWVSECLKLDIYIYINKNIYTYIYKYCMQWDFPALSTGSRAIWFVLPFVITITTECAGDFGCCSAFVIDIIIEELGSIHIGQFPFNVVFHGNHLDTGNCFYLSPYRIRSNLQKHFATHSVTTKTSTLSASLPTPRLPLVECLPGDGEQQLPCARNRGVNRSTRTTVHSDSVQSERGPQCCACHLLLKPLLH